MVKAPAKENQRERVLSAEEIRTLWAGLDTAPMSDGVKAALKLVDDGRVKVDSTADQELQFTVGGSGVDHFVRLRSDGDRCTCPWYSKHPGVRGPCKHILAAQIVAEQDAPKR